MLRDKAGELIKAARQDAAMTQSTLARAAGMHQPTLAASRIGAADSATRHATEDPERSGDETIRSS